MSKQKRRVVLNLQEMRAKDTDAPIIVDQLGDEHIVQQLSVKAYLTVLDLEDAFNVLREQEEQEGVNRAAQRELMERMIAFLEVLVPKFPVRGLRLDELFQVISAAQGSNVVPDDDGGGEAGESSGEA